EVTKNSTGRMLKAQIPHIDLRGKTPIDLLRAYPDRAQALVKAARRTLGIFSDAAAALALPFADRASHRWLKRTRNPFLYEIESFAEILETPGIYALNLCYEWGCTSGAYRTGENVSLLRVLDWPFPQLGRDVVVTLQSGTAGEFYNLTWPGVAGVYTGMAPGRFSAAINQAPMRRHGITYAGDWLSNRLLAKRQNGLPPSHLLRLAFERSAGYEEARQLLASTPLAMPAIFVLAGLKPGQGCLIERTETQSAILELAAGQQVCAANHFGSPMLNDGQRWRSREIDSPGRWRQGHAIFGYDLETPDFSWLQGPIINARTRLAVVANAATGRLMAQGFEGVSPVTDIFRLPGLPPEPLPVKEQPGAGAKPSAMEIEWV
ncbi:MAG: hypothetical protein KGJ06_05900, partial [Pseudomonadota bacterium]|nr:hypothetical protein [Pseudomonadota bacterium]